jgi:hypothetical protein
MNKKFGIFLLTAGLAILLTPFFSSFFLHKEFMPNTKYTPYLAFAPAPKVTWTDYIDKAIGWVVSLSGAYVLIQNSRKKK